MTVSKDRANRMKKMFGNIDPEKLAKAPAPTAKSGAKGSAKPLVSSGAVKSMEDAFSGIEKENESLRQQLATSEQVRSLDGQLIEPSFVQDRMALLAGDEDDDFEELKLSIAQEGQQLPILVRPSPTRPGHYQIAYGRRRLRACLDLGLEVKAIVRSLSDEELVVAQGRENSERRDLSFIETAVFALRLKERGFTRQTIAAALGKGQEKSAQTYISKLTTIAAAFPPSLLEEIGPAPKIGRQKWDKLSGFFHNQKLSKGKASALNGLLSSAKWKSASTNPRFAILMQLLEAKSETETETMVFKNGQGADWVHVQRTAAQTRLSIKHAKAANLSNWLLERLPDLIEDFEKEQRQTQKKGD
ncbi:MAG: plasmid partitioning protein RepB [Cohaesibacter sp.]|nr:plasmid partitioning protein RepB [Cohaesibacter sp.]